MTSSDFTIGQRFHFPDHRAFPPEEIFTVEKVSDDYIEVQSNRPQYQSTPMWVTDVSLATYDDRIRFLSEGETIEPVKKKKILAGHVFTAPAKKQKKSKTFTEAEQSELRHVIRKAEEFIEKNVAIGDRIDFDALLEHTEVIEAGEIT